MLWTNGAGAGGGGGGVGASAGAGGGLGQLEARGLGCEGRHLVLGASPVPVSHPGAGLAAGLGVLAKLLVKPADLCLHPGLLLFLGGCG